MYSLPQAFAGIFEVSGTANYRRSQINELNYQISQSVTASVSYYFMEMSALELSYTEGTSTLRIQTLSTDPFAEYINKFTLYGLDLVITLAQKESVIQPFVKVGGAHIIKSLIKKGETGSVEGPSVDPETVPSAGLGLKIKLTNTFSIKTGIDAWRTQQKGEDAKIDYAGRAGVSLLF
ncbi:MAG: hypothetical protein H6625_07895 [Bdellovibrionaceae bacterium]|nr:hypothetical protein [Pseudobdellovibrionaceae bacterium]